MKASKNLTFNPEILKLSVALMKLRKFDNLSGFLSQLVREEYERRHGAVTFQKPEPEPIPSLSHEPHENRRKKAKGKQSKSISYPKG